MKTIFLKSIYVIVVFLMSLHPVSSALSENGSFDYKPISDQSAFSSSAFADSDEEIDYSNPNNSEEPEIGLLAEEVLPVKDGYIIFLTGAIIYLIYRKKNINQTR